MNDSLLEEEAQDRNLARSPITIHGRSPRSVGRPTMWKRLRTMGWDGGERGEDHSKGRQAGEVEVPEVVDAEETNPGGAIGKDHLKGRQAGEVEVPEVADIQEMNAGGGSEGRMAAASDLGITVRKWIGVRCQCA